MTITSVSVLTSPDISVPFQIGADSLDFANRAVLSQESRTDGK